MGKIIMISGGGRSGKSSYAQTLAENTPGRRVFVATCPVMDDEMRERVRRHREMREHGQWHTVEVLTDLPLALSETAPDATVLVDCLTLWINNLLFATEGGESRLGEDQIRERTREVVEAARSRQGITIFVTNEVGLGIIPENELARRFRDLAGRCNQVLAAAADEVIFMISGIPMTVKSES